MNSVEWQSGFSIYIHKYGLSMSNVLKNLIFYPIMRMC